MDFYWYKYDKKIHTVQSECDLVTLNDNNKKPTIFKAIKYQLSYIIDWVDIVEIDFRI